MRKQIGLSGILLLTSSLCTSVLAQSASDQIKKPRRPAATAGKPKTAPRRSASARQDRPEEVTVLSKKIDISTAGGLLQRQTVAKNVQSVSPDFIAKQSPTQNVVNLLAQEPSLNFSAADPSGLASSNFMVRGLTIEDVGFLLDGAPALPPAAGVAQAQLIDTENIARLDFTPGSSDISDPVTSAAAGTIYLTERNPALRPEGSIDFTYGSYDTFRGFFRLDSGEIGNSGVRLFVSYSDSSASNYRGPGSNKKQHVDAKALKEFGDGNSIALEQAFNRNVRNNYFYPTAQQFKQFGDVNTDAIFSGVNDTAFYKLNSFVVNNETILAPVHLVLNDAITLDDTPYFLLVEADVNGGAVLTQGRTFQGNQPVSINLAQNLPGATYAPGQQVLVDSGGRGDTYIGGNNLKLSWKAGNNTAYAGYWYENYFLPESDPVLPINQITGDPANVQKANNYYTLSNGQKYYSAHYNLSYQLNSIYVGDNLSLLKDRLNINVGFKEVLLTRNVANFLPGAVSHLGISENIPLPNLGIRYNFNRKNEIYVTGEGDYRQPFLGFATDAFSIANGSLLEGSGVPKSEYAIKEEIGYRYNGDTIIGTVSFYNTNLTNRLLTLNTFQNGEQVSETIDAGGQTSRGVDAQIGTVPLWHSFAPYLTFAYLDAKQGNNLATTTTSGAVDYLPTAGKTQIQSPHYQAGIGLSYDDRRFFANLNVKYISSQYSTLTNDEQLPGFVTDTVTLGYRFQLAKFLKSPTLQVNLQNLNNSLQRTGVFSFTNNATTTRGVFGGTIGGTSPTYYIEPGFAAIMTVSAGF